MTNVFEQLESEVRSYCRSWPAVFARARGSRLWDEDGHEYLDFFSGAGALNYGHNHPDLIAALQSYLAGDGILHSLDMSTTAKRAFLERFRDVVLVPRGLDYRVQFPGPTGTNAVEAALKLARKVTGRARVVGFTNAFHGMTLGSLAVTGNSMKRGGAGVPLTFGTSMPYEGFFGDEVDTIAYLDSFLDDSGSGLDLPAAVIVETVQGEGGVNTASDDWLRRLAAVCRTHDVLLVVDDVQVACGRTGPFFSFEPSGVVPDMVCLSKSISGSGLPMALTLLRPELDVWEPGEHNGTFRGNNAAFVTATAALAFWEDPGVIPAAVAARAAQLATGLAAIASDHATLDLTVRGRGLLQGLHSPVEGIAEEIARRAYERGLIVETSGPDSDVVKFMPNLMVTEDEVDEGLAALADAVESTAHTAHTAPAATA